MSPMFVKYFKKQENCQNCKARPQTGRKFCEAHLTKAREIWMLWSLQRRRQGRCSYCLRRAAKGMIRCGIHRAINIQKCRAWYAVHGAESDKRQLEKFDEIVSALRAQGDTRSRRQIRSDRRLERIARRETLYQELSAKYPNVLDRGT